MARNRRDRLPFWLLVGSVLALLLPIAFGRTLYLRDILRFTYPLKLYLRARLVHGELALWNPYCGLGRPFFGVVQPGVLYPLNALLLLPVPHGLDIFFGVHLLILALGMRAWLTALALDELSACAGGVMLALSGYALSVFAGS